MLELCEGIDALTLMIGTHTLEQDDGGVILAVAIEPVFQNTQE